MPLLNQTYGVTPEIARKAYGNQLSLMAAARKAYDPGDRLLNDYFKGIFGA